MSHLFWYQDNEGIFQKKPETKPSEHSEKETDDNTPIKNTTVWEKVKSVKNVISGSRSKSCIFNLSGIRRDLWRRGIRVLGIRGGRYRRRGLKLTLKAAKYKNYI